MRHGVRLGLDPGTVRVGVAASDPEGVLAYPVATLTRTSAAADPRSGAHGIRPDQEAGGATGELLEIARLVAEHEAIEVIVGLPRSLDGGEGPAAERARGYSRLVAAAIAPVPVRLIDERMTSVDAHRNLRTSGVAGREQRRVVDQAAAVLILQSALDLERVTGNPCGAPVTARAKARRKGRA